MLRFVRSALLGFSIIGLAFITRSAAAETQTSFCADKGDDESDFHPVPLPSSVIAAILQSKPAKDTIANLDTKNLDLNPTRLLVAAPIRLARSRDHFFIVTGNYPLSGADNDWFWLVRQSGQRAQVLAFLQGNCVSIGPKSTKGYADVHTTWAVAAQSQAQTYKYDGKRYRLWHSAQQWN